MPWLTKDQVRTFLRNQGIPSARKIDEILSGFDFDKPVYEKYFEEGEVLFQFIRNPDYTGAKNTGNWFALPSGTMDGIAIFGGGSGRHPHKFSVAHPFSAIEGTAIALPRNWDWAGGGNGGHTQIYVPPRLLGHLISHGPQ